MRTTSNNMLTPTRPFDFEPPSVRFAPPDPDELLHQVVSGAGGIVKGWGPAGLILENRFTANLILFGGAAGASIDRGTEQVIPIGPVYLASPRSYLEKQWALRRRIYWINWQQQIIEAYPSWRRAEILLDRLSEHLSAGLIAQLSDRILAKLVGINAEEINVMRGIDRNSST